MKQRTPEGEARRIAAIRSPEARAKMSAAKLGKTPSNFGEAQKKAWAASRKDVLTYSGIHAWVKRNWGPATGCEVCGKQNLTGRSVHWANLDHLYSRERGDWKMMCRPCHSAHDRDHNGVDFSRKSTR